ncbi:hypothetical protein SPONN_1014 [uncultured Candidatus Thioglobus sp.]|nr:hypothetical protein SPONN_1014 [uncultured Candidatus Thioglobus sp.]
MRTGKRKRQTDPITVAKKRSKTGAAGKSANTKATSKSTKANSTAKKAKKKHQAN